MFKIEFGKSFEIESNSVQEGYRTFNEVKSMVLIIQTTSKEKYDIEDLTKSITDNMSSIKVKENNKVIEEFNNYTNVESITKRIIGEGLYFYDILLCK